MPAVVVDQTGRRVYDQRRPADDEHIRRRDEPDRLFQDLLVQRFLIKHHVRADDAAAFAAGHTLAVVDEALGIRPAAAGAVAAVCRAVQLEHLAAAGLLVQSVDVLRDDRPQLSLPLQLRQTPVGRVRLHARRSDQLGVIKAIKLLRVALKKAGRQNRLRRVFVLLVVKPVHTAEIRYPAFRRDARAAEKDNVVRRRDHIFQFFDLRFQGLHPPMPIISDTIRYIII